MTTVSQTLTSDVAIDRQGNLYAAQFPGVVVRISPDGRTTPVAGSGIPGGNQPAVGEPALNATLGPSSVAFDTAGNMYIADQIDKSIWVVNSSGIIISKYADINATRLVIDAAGSLYAIGTDNRVYRVQRGRVLPIDGLTNVVALAAGPGNTLLIAQQALDQDPLHADSEIREVTVSVSDRRSVRPLIR
jgi:filamentous hemagglutinin family protein